MLYFRPSFDDAVRGAGLSSSQESNRFWRGSESPTGYTMNAPGIVGRLLVWINLSSSNTKMTISMFRIHRLRHPKHGSQTTGYILGCNLQHTSILGQATHPAYMKSHTCYPSFQCSCSTVIANTVSWNVSSTTYRHS